MPKTARRKLYSDAEFYEKKLNGVMARFGVKPGEYDYNWSRNDAWVQMRYKGQLYSFNHSINNPIAREKGVAVAYGSDCFAQIVLCLEDLARAAERGIYDLQVWLTGMKALPDSSTKELPGGVPAQSDIPSFFKTLGFSEIPKDVAEVKALRKNVITKMHPDVGGNERLYMAMMEALDAALAYFGATK